MDKNLEKIFLRWAEFEQTHTKLYTPEIRPYILSLYQRLMLELAEEATFTLQDDDTTLSITVTADSFLSSTNFPTLQELIREADTFRADIKDGKIVFDMLFVFWNWVPNEEIQ